MPAAPCNQGENCETGFRSGVTLLGTYVTLGKAAYARQTDPTGTEDDDIQFPGGSPLRPGIDQVRFADDARRMYAAADEPKQLLLVESRFHSSQLVGGYEDDAVTRTRRVIFSFLEAN